MGAFDAGTIEATLRVGTAQASADLGKIEARVKALESAPHVIRVSAVFDDASLAKARAAFSTLDNQISRDALQRLRTSPYGSVLGTLDALFSPHPLAGGPSAQQSASRGLLGQMLAQQATTAVSGTQAGTSGPTLGSVVTGSATGASQAGAEKVTVTQAGAQQSAQAAGDLETAAADGKAAAAATTGAATDTRTAADDLKNAAQALQSAAAAWAIGGLQKLLGSSGTGGTAAAVPMPTVSTAGTDAGTSAVEQLDAQVKKTDADYATLLDQMADPQKPAILGAIPQLEQLEQLITQISDSMSGPGQAGAESVAAFQAQLRSAATALDAMQQQAAAVEKQVGALDEAISAPRDLDVNDQQALASIAQVRAAVAALKTLMAGTPLSGAQAGNVTVNVAGAAQATQQASGLQKALAGVGVASAAGATGLAKFGGAAKAAGEEAEGGSSGFFDLTRQVQLWAGAFGKTELIGQVQLWHILLDGLIESSVIVVETTLTMAETIVKTLPIWEQLYTNIKATDEVAKTFGMSLGPVHVGLTQLQKDLQPGILELYGGVMGLVGKQSSIAAQGIQMVVSGFDTWIAKLDLFQKAQGASGAMLISGYNIMKQLADVLDTLGVAFENLLKSDPGTVHWLLDLAEGAADLVKVFSEIPAPILKIALGLHAASLWGGLLTDALVKMASPLTKVIGLAITGAGKIGVFGDSFVDARTSILGFLQNLGIIKGAAADAGEAAEGAAKGADELGESMEKAGESSEKTSGTLLSLASNLGIWGWVGAGVVALGGLVYWMTTADTATHKLIASLEQGVSSDSASQAILAISVSVGTLDTAITQVGPHIQDLNEHASSLITDTGKNLEGFLKAVPESLASWGDLGNTFAKLGATIDTGAKAVASWFGLVHSSMDKASDVSAFKGAIVSLTGEQDNLFKETGGLIKQGYSYSQALALMDLAGVSATDSFAVMQQKVTNLIRGYQEMSVQGGLLTGAVDAVTFAAEQQKSAVSDITGGWSAFLGVVTGGASALITFEQGMDTLVSDAGAAGASMTGVGTAAVKLKSSLSTVSNASLTLQSQFQSQVTNAEAVQAALLNQASAAGLGAKGTALLTQAGKDLVAQLIPTASGSKEATAELYAFAQIAGYQGPDSLKALTQWLGNTQDAQQNLDKITSQLTVDSAGLTADMNNLATALQQNLNTAMSAAIFQASGGQKAFDAFASAVEGASRGAVTDLRGTAQALANELITTIGNTKQAQGEFVVFAEKLGLTQQQAVKLWDSLTKLTAGSPYAVNLKETGAGTFTISGSGAGASTNAPGTGGKRITAAAAGGLITGGSGPTADDVPVMASGGEYMMQASSVGHYGVPAMAAVNAGKAVISLASGGLVPSYSGAISGLAGATTTDWNDFTSTMTAAMESAMTAAMKSAEAAAASAAAISGAGVSNASAEAALKSAAAKMGWTGAQWQALYDVEMREAGFSLTATNPSSGAYGMAQFINGPSEYAQYGGNANTAAGQAVAMVNYIAQRYGNPEAAWAHEEAFGWYKSGGLIPKMYDLGGWLPPGLSVAANNTGQPEAIVPGRSMAGLFGQMGDLIGSVQGLTDTLSGASGGSTGTAYVGNYTGVVSPASGGFGLTAQQIGITQASSSTSTATSSAATSTSTSASTSTSTTTAAKKPAAPTAAQKAAIAVAEKLIAGYIWHNNLGAAGQANSLLTWLGVSKYSSQLSQISFLDAQLAKARKAKNKAAEASAEHLLTTFGVHVFNPVTTAKGNAPRSAVVTRMEQLIKAAIKANNMTAAGQANHYLTALGTGKYSAELSQISHLDSLLAQYRKKKDSGNITATETLLRQYGVQHFAQGGTVWEPVVGFGQRTGGVYQFAEHGPETVTPGAGMSGGDAGAKLDRLCKLMEKQIATTAAVPARTGEHVGAAFGGLGQQASFARRYHSPGGL